MKSFLQYRVEKELGRSAHAVMYRVSDGQTVYALKVLKKTFNDDYVIAERFRREALISLEVEHPNILKTYALLEDDGNLAMLCEYCEEAKTAQDEHILYASEKTKIDEVCNLLRNILEALQYAHSKGIVHRGIKPQNVLRRKDASYVLADFGAAHVQNLLGLTRSTMFLSTPQYAAPELFEGALPDPRQDLYSLGALAYQLLTGQSHLGENPFAFFQGKLVEPKELNPSIPLGLNAVIIKLLAKLEHRYHSAQECLDALENLENQEPTERMCLFCGRMNPLALPQCVYCGEVFIRIERSYDSSKAKCLVLTGLKEDAAALQHFYTVIHAIAYKPYMPINFIIGEKRLYSKKEIAESYTFPVVVMSHLDKESAAALAKLFEGKYKSRIHLDIRSVSLCQRILKKQGALIEPQKTQALGVNSQEFLKSSVHRINNGTPDRYSELIRDLLAVLSVHYQKLEDSGLDVMAEIQNFLREAECLAETLRGQETVLSQSSLSKLYQQLETVNYKIAQCGSAGEMERLVQQRQDLYAAYERYDKLNAQYQKNLQGFLSLCLKVREIR